MGVISFILLFLLLMLGSILTLLVLRILKLPKATWRESEKQLQPNEWNDEEVTVGWIGHSTVLISIYGYKIITDPVMGHRVGVHGSFFTKLFQLGPRRHVGPAIYPEDLGKVDLILLSHAHLDHFDIPTLRQLSGPETTVVTAKHTSRLLRKLSFKKVIELDLNESWRSDEGCHIEAVPVKHWGRRYPWNGKYGFSGFYIEKEGIRLFFAGDTAYTTEFKRLREKGPIHVACFPIGAYTPSTFERSHCNPEQAWEMFQMVGADKLVPIHWNTFVLSFEPIGEPIERLYRIADQEKDRIVISQQGETYTFTG